MNNRLQSRRYHERKAQGARGADRYLTVTIRGAWRPDGSATLRLREVRKFLRTCQLHAVDWHRFCRVRMVKK